MIDQEQRFTELNKNISRLYAEDSPVIIEAYAIYRDNIEDKILVQIKFKNIGEKIIQACKIVINEFEIDGTPLTENTNYSYLDMTVSQNSCFGSKIPIYLKNFTTRKISIEVVNIVFVDFDIWNGKNRVWQEIEKQQECFDYFKNISLTNEYKNILGTSAKYIPIKSANYKMCTCGSLNSNKNEKCYNCDLSFDKQFEYLDVEKLKKQIEEKEIKRIEQEKIKMDERLKQELIMAEEQKNKKKQILKIVKLVIISLILLTAVVFFMKILALNYKYEHAVELVQNNNYLEGIVLFDELGSFRKAKTKQNEAIDKYLNMNFDVNLTEKIDKVIKLPKNIAIKNEECKNIINNYFNKLITENNYDRAIFIKNEYDTVIDTDINEIKYLKGIQKMNNKEYEAAYKIFFSIYDYKNSKELYIIARQLSEK